jgi:hypothetical protein
MWMRSTSDWREQMSDHEREDDSDETSEEQESTTDAGQPEEERKGMERDPLSDY